MIKPMLIKGGCRPLDKVYSDMARQLVCMCVCARVFFLLFPSHVQYVIINKTQIAIGTNMHFRSPSSCLASQLDDRLGSRRGARL